MEGVNIDEAKNQIHTQKLRLYATGTRHQIGSICCGHQFFRERQEAAIVTGGVQHRDRA